MDEARKRMEEKLDETIEESFPASDPPANTVETGILAHEASLSESGGFSDNRESRRFELVVDDGTAFLMYERTADALRLLHTEVPERFRGRGIGTALVEAALARVRADGVRIVAVCPFVEAYLSKRQRDRGGQSMP